MEMSLQAIEKAHFWNGNGARPPIRRPGPAPWPAAAWISARPSRHSLLEEMHNLCDRAVEFGRDRALDLDGRMKGAGERPECRAPRRSRES
jgi:hypothetical protein